MYIEINTSSPISELSLLADIPENSEALYKGIPYAWTYNAGRYLISLVARDNAELEKHFKVSDGEVSFELLLLNKVLNTKLVFKEEKRDWKDGHKDQNSRWVSSWKGITIHVSDVGSDDFFPYVNKNLLSDLKPFESFCDFMLRQSENIQKDVFLKMVMDFTFPDISDWVYALPQDKVLSKMFREEHLKFVEHMLKRCRENNTLHFISDYISARNDASIALNQISIKKEA